MSTDLDELLEDDEPITIIERTPSFRKRANRMLGKRKRSTSFKSNKKSKYAGKKWTSAPSLSTNGPIAKVIQFCQSTFAITNNTSTFTSLGFTLSNLNDASSFSTIYDEYRVVKAIVKFIPLGDTQALGTAANTCPLLFTCEDWNDVTVPTSINTFLNNDTTVVTPAYRKQVRTIKPNVNLADPSSNPVSASPSQWLPTSNSTSGYYGIKCALTQGGTSSTISATYFVWQEIHFEFRNVT